VACLVALAFVFAEESHGTVHFRQHSPFSHGSNFDSPNIADK
jgi:hypothetical protein